MIVDFPIGSSTSWIIYLSFLSLFFGRPSIIYVYNNYMSGSFKDCSFLQLSLVLLVLSKLFWKGRISIPFIPSPTAQAQAKNATVGSWRDQILHERSWLRIRISQGPEAGGGIWANHQSIGGGGKITGNHGEIPRSAVGRSFWIF